MILLLGLLGCDGTKPDADPTAADTGPDDTGGTDTDSGDTGIDSGDIGDTGPAAVPPRVILFVGDGMGLPHVRGGGLYAYGAEGALVMESLPYTGRIVTASLTGVTDSAAAGTALSSGVKTWNYVVGLGPDGEPVETVLERARARGLAVGVVTTDTLAGATPSSFYAHTGGRGDSEEIAAQLVADPPDVALGGGAGLLAEPFEGADVQLVTTRGALSAAVSDGRPLVGLFADYTLPYVVDGYEEEPTLAEMTAAAIGRLAEDPDGFFLLVEGARIDHASHGNDGERVHQETAAFDEAVAVAEAWAAEQADAPTIVVTADHECGGLHVSGGGSAGTVPDSEWRWRQHTNADVPVFASGPLAAVFDGQRLDNTWVHAVIRAAVDGAAVVTAPVESLLVDGRTTDLGSPVTTQAWETDFGVGYNQLDALRVTADADGLWVGVDGVYEYGENAVLLLVDLDHGAGTGWGADATTLDDRDGALDTLLTGMPYASGLAGLGFDLAFGSLGAEEIGLGDVSDDAGTRGLRDPWGSAEDYWWLLGKSNFDFGNIADGGVATDAGATGATEGGWELNVPWYTVYPSGLPAEGATLAVVAVLLNGDGSRASNQALPPLSSGIVPGDSVIFLESVVLLPVDGGGVALGPATVAP